MKKYDINEASILERYYSKTLVGKTLVLNSLGQYGKLKIYSVLTKVIDGKYEFGIQLISMNYFFLIDNCYNVDIWNEIEEKLSIPKSNIILENAVFMNANSKHK